MRFYFYQNKTNFKEYSARLIRQLLAPWMVDRADDADYTLCSICDISEIGDIAKAKRLGRPVITGGMISEFPVVNELSDYVWHGEIYGFRDAVSRGEAVPEMASITSSTKRRLVIDQRIAWKENPIVRVGRRAMYYYTSKGCPVRCKYCLIGNARDYQVVPEAIYNRALRTCGKNIMPIAAYNPYGVPNKAVIGETLLREYAAGKVGAGARTIRMGVEFVTPKLSRGLAKGVGIDQVNAAIERAGRERTKLIMYFIAGLEPQEVLDDFFSRLVMDYNTSPSVNIVFTYIDPQPFTPLHDLDLRRRYDTIDTKRLFRIATERNKRVRILPLATPAKSTLRTLYGRVSTRSEFELVHSLRNRDYRVIMETIEKKAPALLGVTWLGEVVSRPRRLMVPDYWGSAEYVGGTSSRAPADPGL